MVPTDTVFDALEPVHEVRFAYGAEDHTAADVRQKRIIIAEPLVVLKQLLTVLALGFSWLRTATPQPRITEALATSLSLSLFYVICVISFSFSRLSPPRL